MSISKSLFAAALALAALSAVAPAHAATARASGDVAVRSGPGANYRIIDRLQDGRRYELERCTRESRWCLVSDNGDVLGWVRGSYLVGMPAKIRATPPESLSRFPPFHFNLP